MTLNITIPNNINNTKPRITVIGIGGAGGNAAGLGHRCAKNHQ